MGEEDAGWRVEDAVRKVVAQDLKSLAAGQMGYSTTEVGDLVVKYIDQG
jgi:3-isopropylmalate dehydrogenase